MSEENVEVATEAISAFNVDFRDGAISRIRGYLNHTEALRAAVLPE
jgi:hypothetical protein